MVFEILGVNFLELIKRYNYKGVPIHLVRKLARQCLIGLDYMHRHCKIIHTDFKPENVVIGLRDDEVLEIAKTGQLTTTKMFKNGDQILNFNMKVAGTLPPPKPELPKPSYEGLTKQQKKNLKKKMQKKRKKLDQTLSQAEGVSESVQDSNTQEIDHIEVEVE
jgi:serine/threonine-protein kinase SRPK3